MTSFTQLCLVLNAGTNQGSKVSEISSDPLDFCSRQTRRCFSLACGTLHTGVLENFFCDLEHISATKAWRAIYLSVFIYLFSWHWLNMAQNIAFYMVFFYYVTLCLTRLSTSILLVLIIVSLTFDQAVFYVKKKKKDKWSGFRGNCSVYAEFVNVLVGNSNPWFYDSGSDRLLRRYRIFHQVRRWSDRLFLTYMMSEISQVTI